MSRNGRYEAYGACGLPWLDEAPSHWRVTRMRFVARLNPSKAEIADWPRSTDVSFVPMECIGDNGEVNLERSRQIGDVETGYTYFRDDDVVIAKITPCFENGKGALMRGLRNGAGFGTTELIVVRPLACCTTPRYLNWLFQGPNFRRAGEASMYGAGGQKRVPDDFVRDFAWPLPPIEEQHGIAKYLDRETAKIDALIAEQEKLLALLTEKRQATITQAVTRGLNPDVPMKDSGVPWLGAVPAHWEITRIGHILEAIGDVDHFMPASVDKGFPYLMTGDLEELLSQVNLEDCKQVTEDDYHKLSKKIRTERGDVVMARYATIGTMMYVDVDASFLVSYSCVTLKPSQAKVTGIYLFYCMKSDAFRQGVEHKINTNTQGNVGVEDLRSLKLAIPDIQEQREISAFLDSESNRSEALKVEAERGISLLRERRSSLISAAVTGKIDVRNLARETAA